MPPQANNDVTTTTTAGVEVQNSDEQKDSKDGMCRRITNTINSSLENFFGRFVHIISLKRKVSYLFLLLSVYLNFPLTFYVSYFKSLDCILDIHVNYFNFSLQNNSILVL